MSTANAVGVWIAIMIGTPPVPTVHTDGHHIAPRQETSQFYDCGSISAAVRYRTEQSDNPQGGDTTRRVTLLGLAVNGHDLSPDEVSAVADLFGRFAAIEAMGSNCFREFLEIRLLGTTSQRMEDYYVTGEQPDNEFWTIRLSAQGIVFVR